MKVASSDKAAILRRIRGWRAAGEQERKKALCQVVPSPAISLAQAMVLQDLVGRAGPDPAREREVDRVRAQWRWLPALGQ